MNFMSVREFRLNTGQARKGLQVDGELVLTTNGRPFAIVSAVQPETFDREPLAIRRSRARVAIDRLRENARAVVVTGNHKHYPTRVCGKVRVLSPAELIESLRK